MEFNTIIFEKNGGIAKITLNRPKQLNAVNEEVLLELQAAIEDIEKDDSVSVLVIAANGRAFCAGADLAFMEGILNDTRAVRGFLELWRKVYDSIEELAKPVIASINGVALAGGLELVSACDLAIASEDAQLGDQHAVFGLIPGGGNSQRLPRLVGMRKAKELLFTGDWVSAKEAEGIGLINRAVPADKLEETVNEMAKKLAVDRSPLASKIMKSLVNQGIQINLSAALDLELDAAVHHYTASEDFKEGIAAFSEKRKPVFKGR
jgi:enoyl-CoA hydratase/carnithine racemase